MAKQDIIVAAIDQSQEEFLAEWMKEQLSAGTARRDLIKENELREQSREFISLFRTAIQSSDNARDSAWDPVRELLASISRSRTQQGFSPSEVATFVFSFKQPLFIRLSKQSKDSAALSEALWKATQILDALGLLTTEIYQRAREEVINRQQQEMMELSTPVVKLYEGILALPLIGTLDSGRTQVVLESLLQRIVETGADKAILDITGVPTVDTLVAQHLLKTITAARLMGADCIISGIRPQIAQTIVHLGVDLKDVITKASLADAFKLALTRLRLKVVRVDK